MTTMKIKVKDSTSAKPVAVLGIGGLGIFIPNREDEYSTYISEQGCAVIEAADKFSDIVRTAGSMSRTVIYEGDEVTLKFVKE